MISIGEHYRGPELHGSKVQSLLGATSRAIISECGRFVGAKDIAGVDIQPSLPGRVFHIGSAPSINVVFYVPGSLGDFDIPKIEASRFSRKQKLLLVAVPVPKKIAQSGGSVEFVIDALHQATAIAAETFMLKKAGEFELVRAEAIIDKVEQALIDQGF